MRYGRGGGRGEPRPGVSKELPQVSPRRLYAILWPYRKRIALSAVLMLYTAAVGLVFPLGVKRLIDTALTEGDPGQLNWVAVALVVMFLSESIASFVQGYISGGTGERLGNDLGLKVADHLLSLPMRYYDRNRSGDILAVVGSDVTLVRSGTLGTALPLLSQVVRLAGSVAIAFYLNWRLAMIVVVITPIVMGIAITAGRRVRALSRETQQGIGEATAVLNEVLANIRVVKSFGREPHERERYWERMARVLQLGLRRNLVDSAVGPVITLLSFGAITAVLWFGGQEVLAGRLSAGDLVAFLIYLLGVAAPIGVLTRLYTQLQQALGAAQRIFALIDEPVQVADRLEACILPSGPGLVEFRGVHFSYAEDRPVLHGLDIRVEPGQTCAVVGPSGAGKTTTIGLLLRLYDVTGGAVVVDGCDVRDATQASLREAMALVPQEPVLFATTVGDNIRYGRLDATEAEVETAARAANAHEFVSRLPSGYSTEVGERGVQLSAGQRQRIAIARAILRNPRILLLDEATASLDNESEYLVQEALDRLMRDRTTIVVAHRLTTIENADQIVVLDGGRCVESGTHSALLARNGLYARLWTRSFEDEHVPVTEVPVTTAI
jgi:subfamily B ATP-binding cassette protein MsbA